MSDEFSAYQSNPTADNLIRLLRATQDRIFHLCHQVLRREHDAQDAAQEVLIRIAAHVRTFEDAGTFRRWVYRVSLNAALESARKSGRRRQHEARAAMKGPGRDPLDEEARHALFDGIAKLEDGPRCLFLDHYLEGETLERLAAREGISPQAVSKRLDRVREDLRRTLPAGLIGVDFSQEFKRRPGGPVADLVTGPVLMQALAVAGGAAMTTKATLSVVLSAAVLAALGIGVATASLRTSSAELNNPAPGKSPGEASVAVPNPQTPDTETGPGATPVDEPARLSPLGERLREFKTWWDEIEAERISAWNDHEKASDWRKRHEKELWERLSGLKGLILTHPEDFLRFLGDPANEPLLLDFTQMNVLMQTDIPYVYSRDPFSKLPPALTQGLHVLLHNGSGPQRVAVIRLLFDYKDVTEEFRSAYLALIDDPDPQVQGFAIHQVGKTVPLTPTLFSKLAAMGTTSESSWIRLSVLSVMRDAPGPEGETFLLNRLATVTEPGELFNVFLSLSFRYEAERREGRAIQEEQLARSLSDFAARTDNVRVCWFFRAATFLPADRLKPILIQLQSKSAYGDFRGRLQKAVEMIERGESKREELLKVLDER